MKDLLDKGKEKFKSLTRKGSADLNDNDMDFDVTSTPVTKYKNRRKMM